jgi:hypothetical protein
MNGMNLKDYPRRDYAIDQFCQPPCYELDGQSFRFIMDGGRDYELKITGRETCQWNIVGEEPKNAKYDCRKADDTTYLLNYDLIETLDTPKRVNHLYVIDMEQRLVTMVRCYIGDNPKFPLLVRSEYDFGAIEEEGKELPFKRHCFTGDLMGTMVEWHWNTFMWTQHCYNSPAYYRITWPQDSTAVEKIGGNFEYMPSSDEIAQYVKIKDNMYLFCLTEEMMERIRGDKSPFRSNNMIFLQNYDRMYHCGRTFGSLTINGKILPCKANFGAFGNPVRLDPEWVTAENPYTV